MTELIVNRELVGRKVMNAGRTDWGVGVVEQVVRAGGPEDAPVYRVTVQFSGARRTLLSPPARLIEPRAEEERQAGWLDTLAGRTVDDRLKRVPESLLRVLGTPRQKLDALLPLYEYDEEPKTLARWARTQTGVGDPLSKWSRDELTVAWAAFCADRDAALRAAAAMLRQAAGPESLREWLAGLEEPVQGRVREALGRVI
mgnify:CR=1 FL=1